MYITMKNDSGVEKKVKCGFSWTTFFFGWIPSLIRGDIVSAIKLFLLGWITIGIYKDYKSYNINRDYYNILTEKGYKSDEEFILETNIVGNILVGISIGLKILLIIAAIVMNIFVVSLGFSSIEDCLNDGEYSVTQDFVKPSDRDTNTDTNKSSNASNPGYNKKATEFKEDENANSSTYKEDGNIDFNIYKKDVSREILGEYNDKIQSSLSSLYTKYGESYRTYGLVLDSDPENAEQQAKEYYETLDKILNQEWSYLRKVLNEEEMNSLIKEQNDRIKRRDTLAEDKSKSSPNADYIDALYYTGGGEETQKRIMELSDRFLNLEN